MEDQDRSHLLIANVGLAHNVFHLGAMDLLLGAEAIGGRVHVESRNQGVSIPVFARALVFGGMGSAVMRWSPTDASWSVHASFGIGALAPVQSRSGSAGAAAFPDPFRIGRFSLGASWRLPSRQAP